MSACSKAPWGLSVLPRVTRIFTSTTISPDLLLRQCPNRYTFRAGRNLPDKEFRYLRTVIVTAAVYWGLSSKLLFRWLLPLTFQHRAGVSPYTSSFDLAETCVFGKQSLGPVFCGRILLHLYKLHKLRHPFSRSYGVILPSSLTIVLPLIFGFSPCLPVSVFGTGTFLLDRGFSWQRGLSYFTTYFRSHSYLRIMKKRICLSLLPTYLDALFHQCANLPFCVTPSLKRLKVVLEFQPVVHRLRLLASA